VVLRESFARLQDLQVLDTEINTLAAKLAEIPERIRKLKSSAERVRKQLNTTKDAITEHRKQYKLAEVELKAAEEKISSYSVQLYSAKTNEQYKAFLKEIETQKRIKSEVEDRMILLMEEAETLERQCATSEKEDAQLDADTARKVAALENEQSELNSAKTAREEARAEIIDSLPSNTLKLYERIRKSRGGVAVVTTKGERCNGCLNPVPAQRMLEIERLDRIYTCEACGRILVPHKE
jgi:predicted  nucleic acid-binding Zn-ribbon protein